MVAAVIGAAVVGAGATIYSGNKAAAAQKKASQQAGDIQRQQYEQTRADLSPYREAGLPAMAQYQNLLGMNGQDAARAAMTQYTESPFLAQLVKRTQEGVDGSAAARGGLFSGSTAQGIADRTGQLYLGDYNNYLSRIGGLVDTGQNAAAQTGNFGANAAAGRANSAMAAGNASANNWINTGNSINNFLGQAAGTYGAYKAGAFNTPGTNYFLNGGSASQAAKNALGIT